MIRGLIAACLLVGSMSAFGSGFSANMTLTNAIIWRGIQFNPDGSPGIGGGINYKHDSGFSVGTVTYNLTAPFMYELNHYLAYTYKADDWTVTGTVYRYYFPRHVHASRMGYRVTGTWMALTASVEYMPEYFWGPGFAPINVDQSSDIYATANWVQPIDETVSIVPQIGYTSLSNGKLVGFKNYMDYSLALRYSKKDDFTAELGWVGTDRKVYANGPSTVDSDTSKAGDERPYFKLTKTF